MTDERLDELIEMHLAGELGPADREEFETMLTAAPEARRRLVERARFLVELGSALGRPLPAPPAIMPARRLGFPRRAAAAAAAILAAVVIAAVAILRTGDDPAAPTAAEREVARGAGGERDDSFAVGERIEVEGAAIRAIGTTVWELGDLAGDGRRQLRLDEGRLEIEVPEGGRRFRIATPAGAIEDVGTRFEIEVAGASAGVLVRAGRLRFRPKDAGPSFEVGPVAGRVLLRGDGRVAEVLEQEGLLWLRPAASPRRSPIGAGTILRPGDLVGTGRRGAHAAALRFANGVLLQLGPGSRLEILDGDSVRLDAGEFACEPADGASLRLRHGEGGEIRPDATPLFVAADERGLRRLDEAPAWYEGFRSDRLAESMGSLVASVDGRDVPLTIGYHKVTVDVRDQIARTTIDETFVNRTERRLEGEFHFPLPPDASVSSFAMWIGDEKVEGEIVERGRAREIYETLLRERRDPGLLEWSGGSIFRARVFPIDAEKRIRISYTQVLPLVGDRVSYRYPLRSELLRRFPLDRLDIEVRLHSAAAILEAGSSSHHGRETLAGHSAALEFTADRVRPDRDFEYSWRIERRPGELRLLPHLRGDEGYFMAMVTPPEGGGDDRDLLPAGEPHELIVLVDDSASTDDRLRSLQAAFLEALMSSLRPEDTIDVGLFSDSVRFLWGGSMAADERSAEEALAMLAASEPLGWTDLGRALAEARDRATRRTRVILLTDGGESLASEDPAAMVRGLAAAWQDGPPVAVVALGGSTEDLLLEDIARLGDGSIHRLAGREEAATRAREVLGAILNPGLADLAVEIAGVPLAAVHPVTAATLPAGAQAVLVGRFDAALAAGETRVIVRGRCGNRPFGAECLANPRTADEANSFIPRLWARRHLDHLLRMGTDPGIVASILDLSRAYQIATPYSSFLVLETEADRRRFGIARRVRMRDGEDFFDEGREAASFAVARAQMEKAKGWRRDLGARVLAKYESAGLDLMGELLGYDDFVGGFGLRDALYTMRLGLVAETRTGITIDDLLRLSEGATTGHDSGFDGPADSTRMLGRRPAEIPALGDEIANQPVANERRVAEGYLDDAYGEAWDSRARNELYFPRRRLYEPDRAFPLGGHADRGEHAPRGAFAALFPAIPSPAPGPERETEGPEALRAILDALDVWAALRAADSGFALRWRRRLDLPDEAGRPGVVTALIGRAGVHQATEGRPGEPRRESWLTTDRRGAWDELFDTAAERAAAPGDDRNFSWPVPLLFADLARRHHGGPLVLRELEGDRLELDSPPESENGFGERIVVGRDPVRLLSHELYTAEGSIQRLTFADHLELAGHALPRRIESFDAAGKRVDLQELEIEEIGAEALRRELATRRAARAGASLVGAPPRNVYEARGRLLGGQARIEDHLLLLDEALTRQQRLEAAPHHAALAAAFGDGPLARALALRWAEARGENEEVLDELRGLAMTVAAKGHPAEIALATLIRRSAARLSAGERLEILAILEPVQRRSPRPEDLASWRGEVLDLLQQAGRPEALERRLRAFLEESPDDFDLHRRLIALMVARREIEAATAATDRLIEEGRLGDDERSRLGRQLLDDLWSAARHDLLLDRAERWRLDPAYFDQLRLGRHLLALLHEGRLARFEETALDWLALSAREKRDRFESLKLQVALNAATGRLPDLPLTRQAATFLPEVVAAARRLGREQHDLVTALGVVDSPLRDRPELKELGEELDDLAFRERATLPLEGLALFVSRLEGARRRELVQAMVERFLAGAGMDGENAVLGATLAEEFSDLRLRVLAKLRRLAGSDARRNEIDTLTYWLHRNRKLDDACEARLLELAISFRAEAETAAARRRATLAARLRALLELLPHLVAERREQLLAARQDLEDLGPRAAKAAREEAERAARLGRAASLEKLLPQAAADLAPWLRLMRLIELRAGGAAKESLLADVLVEARAALARGASDDDVADRVLAERWFCLAADLALALERPAAIDALLAEAEVSSGLEVRRIRIEWLCAAARATDLDRELELAWTEGEAAERILWGRAQAWNLAASGRLAEAVAVLRALDGLAPLGPEDLEELALWLQVLDDREGMRTVRRRRFAALDEWSLSGWLQARLGLYQGRGERAPEAMGEEIPQAFEVLFAGTPDPGRHLWILRQYWQTTRDHRLLAAVVAALPRQSARGIHDFVYSMRLLVEDVHEEAALDALDRALARGIAAAGDPRIARAMSILRLHAAERALAQLNGAAAWRVRVLDALRGSWSDDMRAGDRRRHAALLAGLGRIEDAEVRREALAQLARLQAALPIGAEERFQVACERARLMQANDLGPAGRELLMAALREIASADDDRLPDWTRQAQKDWADQTLAAGEAVAAESFWRRELERDYAPDRADWIVLRLFEALAARCGREAGAYGQVRADCLARLAAESDADRAGEMLAGLCRIWSAAGDLARPEVEEDARKLAADFPALLARHHHERAGSFVQTMAHSLRELLGPTEALRFLLDRVVAEPAHREALHRPLWESTAHLMADVVDRAPAAADGDLRDELERFVLGELAADLGSGVSYDRAFYSRGRPRTSLFAPSLLAETARGVLEIRPRDEVLARRIANYLRQDLRQPRGAADFLADFDRRRPLGFDGLTELLAHLMDADAKEAALAVVERLIALRNDLVGHAVTRAELLFDLGRREEAIAAALAVEKRFLPGGTAGPGPLETLARLAWSVGSDEQSVRLHRDLIRRAAREGGTNQVSWEVRARLGESLLRLGRGDEAVAEAAAAVVLWPARSNERAGALAQLRELLTRLPDLAAWQDRFEAELAAAGRENPILRAALAQVHETAGRHAEAARQLRLALQVAPEREDWRELLIAALDAAGREREGDAELLELARGSPHDLALWQRLAGRLGARGEQERARRALETLVEFSPREAEGLALFAAAVAGEGRLEEAIAFFDRVDRARPEDPGGLLGRLEAEVRLGRKADARETAGRLRSRSYAQRFGNLEERIAALLGELDE